MRISDWSSDVCSSDLCGTPGPHGVDCQVQRTGGDGGFEACWDLVVSCQNGGEMTASACHEMAAGDSQGSENMPVAGFSIQDSCAVPASGRVERLQITSKSCAPSLRPPRYADGSRAPAARSPSSGRPPVHTPRPQHR